MLPHFNKEIMMNITTIEKILKNIVSEWTGKETKVATLERYFPNSATLQVRWIGTISDKKFGNTHRYFYCWKNKKGYVIQLDGYAYTSYNWDYESKKIFDDAFTKAGVDFEWENCERINIYK